MIGRDSLRRLSVFALIFGGAVGVLVWKAGGLRTRPQDAVDEAPPGAVHVGPVAPVGPNIGVARSENGVLHHDSVKAIGDKTCTWRSWTASYKTGTPTKSQDPDVAVLEVESPRIVLFPAPQSVKAPPLEDGSPGTTRITAKNGVLEHQRDVRTRAHLAGDVVVERFDPGGDFRLRAPTLDCAMESKGGVEKRRATTSDAVTIDAGRAHVQGTGLDADFTDLEAHAVLLKDVQGVFEAPPGAIVGGAAHGKAAKTTVTCSGACDVVSLDAKAKAADRRWKATFHDDVHVVEGGSSLDCDVLEIEFKIGEAKGVGDLPPQRVVAAGHVRVKGRTETRTYEIDSQRATHFLEGVTGNEADVVVFEGDVSAAFLGPLAAARAPGAAAPKTPAAAARGRMDIKCDGPATMRTVRSGNFAAAPYRTSIAFEKNVVVKQWDDEKLAATTGELHAPKATLYGTRLPNGQLQPDYLTAEDGVDLMRTGFASHSQTATWARVEEFGIQRTMLSGKPKVDCTEVRPLHVFGASKSAAPGTLTLAARDNVTVDVYDERPPVAGEPPRPYAVLTAGPGVVLVQSEEGREVSRLTCAQLQATVAQGRQLQHVEAVGDAHAWGFASDGQQADLYGAKILFDELVLPPGAGKDAPRPARVTAVGDAASPAVAVLREKNGDRHDIRADLLRYEEAAATLDAQTNVVATLDMKGREDKPGSGLPKLVDGSIRISAGRMHVDLSPEAAGASSLKRLRKVTASDEVVVDGRINRIVGHDAVYDGVTGIAEVRGVDADHPARMVNTAESERYASFVNSALIRAYFDVSDDPARRGRPLRVACPGGGMIVRYINPPDAPGRPAGEAARRLVLTSQGPLEMTRTEATAVDDVRAGIYELGRARDWNDNVALVHCDKARVTFDADAGGEAKDRLRTLDAWGAGGRQVDVQTPQFHARADHVEVDFLKHTLHLSTTGDKDVYVRDLASGRQWLYGSAVFDYVTKEWSDMERPREIETPQQTPERK